MIILQTQQPNNKEMNKDNAKEFLQLVQAMVDGKTIQFLTGGEWQDAKSLAFTEPIELYRIKPDPPKPREWWARVATFNNTYATEGNIVGGSPERVPNRPNEHDSWVYVKVIEELNQ